MSLTCLCDIFLFMLISCSNLRRSSGLHISDWRQSIPALIFSDFHQSVPGLNITKWTLLCILGLSSPANTLYTIHKSLGRFEALLKSNKMCLLYWHAFYTFWYCTSSPVKWSATSKRYFRTLGFSLYRELSTW